MYSAPVIGGAAAASASSSSIAGAGIAAWCASKSGCMQMAVTSRAATSRQ
jgi:hypothetical protein